MGLTGAEEDAEHAQLLTAAQSYVGTWCVMNLFSNQWVKNDPTLSSFPERDDLPKRSGKGGWLQGSGERGESRLGCVKAVDPRLLSFLPPCRGLS